jgi:phage replication O-like protein O
MNYKQTTQIPNELIEAIPNLKLSGSEVKLLLIFYRATWGWHKTRDRLTFSELIRRTGLGHRIISTSIQSLIDKELLRVTDYQGESLNSPQERKGKLYLFYTPLRLTSAVSSIKQSNNKHQPMQKQKDNKTNVTKPIVISKKIHQGTKKITDKERIQQILWNQNNSKS